MADERLDVQLTQSAEDDLEQIHAYLVDHDVPDAADALLDGFLDVVASLERFPMRGSLPKELEPLGVRDFRQILLSPYRIIYRVIDAKVFILLIADGRRDMQALLERWLLGKLRHRADLQAHRRHSLQKVTRST